MDEVERDAIDVMFIRAVDDVAEFGPAFQRLEELVGTRGRKFFGAFYPREKEYHACVQLQDADDPVSMSSGPQVLSDCVFRRFIWIEIRDDVRTHDTDRLA